MIKLNLGCGKNKLDGYINIDNRKTVNPDLQYDLSKNIPFKNNSVDQIYSSHFIEHVDLLFIMKEIHRVLKIGGTVKIIFPFAGHPSSYQYDHKYFIKPRDLWFFDHRDNNDYNGLNLFEITKVKYKHGIPISIFPLWLIGQFIENYLNRSTKKMRGHYDSYISSFFPMKEFTIELKKVKK